MPEQSPFKVVYFHRVRKALVSLARNADSPETKDSILTSARAIHQALSNEPRTFGEALYRLPQAKLQVRLGAKNGLAVTFGVYDDQPLVFVNQLTALQ